jgi:hypothetical protein
MKIARHAQNRLGMGLGEHHRPRQSWQHHTQVKSAVETSARGGITCNLDEAGSTVTGTDWDDK